MTTQKTFLAEVSDLVQTEPTKYLSDDYPIAMLTPAYLSGPDNEDYLRTTVFFEDGHPELDPRVFNSFTVHMVGSLWYEASTDQSSPTLIEASSKSGHDQQQHAGGPLQAQGFAHQRANLRPPQGRRTSLPAPTPPDRSCPQNKFWSKKVCNNKVIAASGYDTITPIRKSGITTGGKVMLKSLGLASFKGGVGKTMIAYSLAERATASGLRVMLLDFDPNEGPMALATLRDDDLPSWSMESLSLTASGLRALERYLKSDDHDLLICDLPGADSTLFLRLLGSLDLVLSPLGAGVSDLFVATEFAATLRRFSLPGWFVGNTLPPGKARREEFAAALESYEYINVCPVQVVNRVAHIDAARRGLSACEWDPSGQAAREIDQLWSWVAERLEVDSLALVA